MHVVQILPALEAGGVERGTLEIGAALVRAGHRSTVISSGGRLVPELVAAGSVHIEMPVHAKRIASLSQVGKLRNVFSGLGADIVHARSRLPAWLAWWAIRRLAVDRRPRFVTTVHGLYTVNGYSGIMTRGERVVAISASVRDYILANYPRCDPEIVRLIHRGVDATEFPRGHVPPAAWRTALWEEFPELTGKRLLVLPGRLVRWKGGSTFLRLLAEVAPSREAVHGVLVGGPDRPRSAFPTELTRECGRLGLGGRVTFAGHRSDLREWLASAELCFNLSTHPEPFGRTVIEALSLGTPVVAFDSGGPAETVAACFPQGLVPDGDFEALVGRVAALLDGVMPEVRPCPFELSRMQDETLRVYAELLAAD
ncbi:MAG: glycosyltransferase family 4 protein [Gammaproteobacteria bacterium]|nr:glycosyltransferase family 4 protein [Gammaproteobacteria bacterium]